MEDDHVATLREARERLLADRRNLAKSLAAPYAREAAQAIEREQRRFVEVQQAIEAVDAAIDDEKKQAARAAAADVQQPRWDTVEPDADPLDD